MNMLYVVLSLLILKHFVAEYCLFFKEMKAGLPKFWNLFGIFHIMVHAVLSFFVLVYFAGPALAGIIAAIELVGYYLVAHIVYRYAPKDTNKHAYQVVMGIPQLIHLLMYVAMIYAVFNVAMSSSYIAA